MEPKGSYTARFVNDREMRRLFGCLNQRVDMALQVFAARWKEAIVTVRKADGEEFFID